MRAVAVDRRDIDHTADAIAQTRGELETAGAAADMTTRCRVGALFMRQLSAADGCTMCRKEGLRHATMPLFGPSVAHRAVDRAAATACRESLWISQDLPPRSTQRQEALRLFTYLSRKQAVGEMQ